jgi:protein SCO1/2
MIVYFRVEKERLERKRIAEMSKGVGRPKVGGPFTLMDLDGKEFTAEDLKGKYSFVCGPPLFSLLGMKLWC